MNICLIEEKLRSCPVHFAGVVTDSYKAIATEAVSGNKNFVHTVLFRDKIYYEVPRMEYKRHEHSCPVEGPQRKIRKVVNMSPGVRELLKSNPDVGAARLHVRQEGDEVFISIRFGVGDNVEEIPIVPRDQPPRRPKRSAGC